MKWFMGFLKRWKILSIRPSPDNLSLYQFEAHVAEQSVPPSGGGGERQVLISGLDVGSIRGLNEMTKTPWIGHGPECH